MMNVKSRKILDICKALALPIGVYLVLMFITQGRFGSPASLSSLLRTSMIPAMLGMSMSFCMSMGMWNFAMGAIVYASSIFSANLANLLGWGIPGVCLFSILVSMILNIIVGWLYNRMRIPCLVLSLGLAMVFEALPSLFIENSAGQISLMDGYLANAPWCYIIVGVMFVIFFYVNNYTIFGANMRAIGSNIALANNAGVDIDKVKFKAFLISGFFTGITSILYISTNVSVIATYGFQSVSIIFDGMMGIFVAGVLAKYINYSICVIIGIVTIRMLSSGLVALGMSSQMRSVMTGAFLFVVLTYSANAGLLSRIKAKKQIAAEANSELG